MIGSPHWPRLVLVEGLPGSGKSTTAQWVALELERQGRRAQWVYEQAVPHPVHGPRPPPGESWRDGFARRLGSWARFAAEVGASDAPWVIDSAFLQTPVAITLRRGLDAETIGVFLDRVADIVRPLDPALVYFSHPDTDAAFRRICAVRGMAWTLQHISLCDASAWARNHGATGMDGILAYWREHTAVCDAAVSRARLRTITVDAQSTGWPVRRRRIGEFLGLASPASAPPAEPDQARYVGRYRRNAGREVRVELRDGQLVIDRLVWFSSRLLPVAPGVFDAESWAFRLTFESAPSGAVRRFRLGGPALPSADLSGIYERVG